MKNEMTFEQAMEKLTAITDKLSNGRLPLDDMVKLYEEGEKLSKYCAELLDSYEARLSVIENGESEK